MECSAMLSGGVPCLPLIPLGTFYKDKYHISNECSTCLDEIGIKLNLEDSNTRSLRRALGFMNIIKQDLVPILIEVKNQPSVLRSTIKLLVWLTLPVECLVFTETSNLNPDSQIIIYELTRLLYNAKEAFLDPRVFQALLEHLYLLLKRQRLSSEDSELINNSLLLIRNILHAPERPTDISTVQLGSTQENNKHPQSTTANNSQQKRLLRNLFVQGLDRLLNNLLKNSQKEKWVVAIGQLIPLIYQNYCIGDIEKLFGISPKSEIFFGKNNKETANSDKLNRLENFAPHFNESGESITVNNQQRMEFESERYLKDNTTQENLLKLLKEFTSSFLLNGYNTLIDQLHQQLMQQKALKLDKSFFFWLIAYFLRFASQLNELDIGNCKNLLTIDLLSFLTYEAVQQTEEFEANMLHHSIDLKPCLRRLQLNVIAISEYLQTLENCSRLVVSRGGKKSEKIFQLHGYLPALQDLRQLFLLQLRTFNPKIQSRRYLLDVITGNHILLLTLERVTHQSGETKFDLRQHLKQFCSRTIVSLYGTALEDFKTNGSFANDCILTMLHHIAGVDLGCVNLLLDPVILQPFCKIHEEKFDAAMCDDWFDLIGYVLRKYFSNGKTKSFYTAESLDQRKLSSGDLDLLQNFKNSIFKTDDDDSFLETQDIETTRSCLKDLGFQKQLEWVQSTLLVVCSARLGTYADGVFRNPVIYHSLKMKVSCPIVPWTESEVSALCSKEFLSFLHRMGLLSNSALYPRIPSEWSATTLYSIALCFGPIDQKQLDFNLSQIKGSE